MKGLNVIDKRVVEIKEDGSVKEVAWKGHIEPISIKRTDRHSFLDHTFTKETLMTIHEASWKDFDEEGIEYCGG